MSRYNTTTVPVSKTKVENHQGGTSYKMDPKMELVSLLVQGLDNTYYEKLSDRENRLKNLIEEISKKNPLFVAKALIYTRSVVGQRTVTHLASVFLAPYLSGLEWSKKFFSKRDRKVNKGGIVYRTDDMLEIIAAYIALNPNKPLPSSLKKGFKMAIENSDAYELAKYQAKSKNVSLVDVFNLVHPKPTTEQQAQIFKDLMSGNLKQFNTMEDKLSSSGQEIAKKVKEGKISKQDAKLELEQSKEENFLELLETGKIGYLALLRNLRSILQLETDNRISVIDMACSFLTNDNRIKSSLVFPHQIDLASEVLLSELPRTTTGLTKVLTSLNLAYEKSIPNIKELFTHGKTAVVLDTSDSMSREVRMVGGKMGSESRLAKGALVAATLFKGIDADLYHYADYTQEVTTINPIDSVNTIKNQLMALKGKLGYGTNMNSIFELVKNKYDRIFIISDMQGNKCINPAYYKHIKVYAVDMQGYGTSMFETGKNLYQILGYGSDIYELIRKVEIDPKALIKAIEDINI
jgi:60 kDa SS-A/Ro ribonucleoprotein